MLDFDCTVRFFGENWGFGCTLVAQLVDTRPGVGGLSGSNPVDPNEFLYFDPKLLHASSK
uniref:UBC core domain-containing protein n=1 Tax=Bursaphelenchus xylophilus TaxID=6326 RepID=A0A1I7SPQ6_BURXY